MVNELKLKVAEAIQDDVNKGIVRIDSSFMHELGIRPGDIIEIEGERKTVAISDRAYPGDIGLNIIRMDGLVRRNAKAGIGEIIQVRKAKVAEAKKVTIAPQRKGIVIRANPIIFKQGLLGRAVMKGDIVSLGGTRSRRSTLSTNPDFREDIFDMLDESLMNFGLGDLKFVVIDSVPKSAVIITETTEVIFNPEATDVVEERALEVTYEDIGGLQDEITKIREMVELPLKHPEIFEALGIEPPKGVLLHGPPGTGKTLLAKAVANETNANFLLINGPEIMSKYYGQSEENLRKKFEEAEKNAPSIIFIDEIDAIASKREESRGEVERRVVAQMLALMDGLKARGRVVVIGATNIPNELDPALRRPGRFDRELEIGVPNIEGRLNILKIHTRNMPLTKNVVLKEFAEITHGFVGADLSALAKEAAMTLLRRIYPDLKLEEDQPIPREVLEKLKVSKKDFIEALKVVRPSAMREVLIEVPNVTWEDVGGMEDIKQELEEAIEWPLKHPDVFKKMGVRPPKGILLYGAPGTGKTLMAKAVAHESKANFILVKGPELLSKWVGESEKAVRKIFEKARQTSPTIIFFDEIDSLAPRRGISQDSNVTERVVNQLLTEMDGMIELDNIVILGATNRPDMLDTALLRPGRFDRIILSSAPDEKARLEIFKIHTKDMPLEKDVDINEMAKQSEGYVGADIEAVCREAALLALRKDIKASKVNKKNFEAALKKVSPSITKEVADAYQDLLNQFRSARGKEMKDTKPSYYG
jgi:transitional endoplasmic reticulum ATPase